LLSPEISLRIQQRSDYILMITILPAFLEARPQLLSPYQPPVLLVFSGVLPQEPIW
jgi:hypothetical protein